MTIKLCPVCGQTKLKFVFTETVLDRYPSDYYVCTHCGFLKADAPYWLEEAYRHPIADSDTGLVMRSIRNRRILEPILHRLVRCHGKFLDVGGGYGLLTRLLRDIGIDCYTYDKYCQNIFSKGFEPFEGFRATAIFSFEVFEHIEDPVGFIKDATQKYGCQTIIFSTLTYSGVVPARDWWYYSFHTGQHISFYTSNTIDLIAQMLGSRYYKLYSDYHLITDRELTQFDKFIFLNNYARRLYGFLVRLLRSRRSLTAWDENLRSKK
jgi:hypothetical protein